MTSGHRWVNPLGFVIQVLLLQSNKENFYFYTSEEEMALNSG